MKKLMPLAASIVLILVASVFASAGTLALFTDTETSTGNIATAGILDLKVEGSSWDDDPIVKSITVANMKPGDTHLEVFTLKNFGTIAGDLTLKVKNPVSNENTLEEPELAAGDAINVEVDPTGYDANGGDGELWDQCKMHIFYDSNDNQVFEGWLGDIELVSTSMGLDMTSYYSIALDTDLASGKGINLGPSDMIDIVVKITFMDDTGSPFTSQPQYPAWYTNNFAMSDDIVFDIEFGLVQS